MRLVSAWRTGLLAATAAAVTLGIAAPAMAYPVQPPPGRGVAGPAGASADPVPRFSR